MKHQDRGVARLNDKTGRGDQLKFLPSGTAAMGMTLLAGDLTFCAKCKGQLAITPDGDGDGTRQNGQIYAYMGNPHTMAFLGEKMDAGADGIEPGYWGNIPIAIKMIECALAQGYSPVAVEMKPMYEVPRAPDGTPIATETREPLDRVLWALHEGLKGGCEYCSNRLFIEFDHPDELETMVVPFIDKACAQRYDILGVQSCNSTCWRTKFPLLTRSQPGNCEGS